MHMRTLLLLHTGFTRGSHGDHTGFTRGSHGDHMGITRDRTILGCIALLTGGGGGGLVKCTTSYKMKELTGASIRGGKKVV